MSKYGMLLECGYVNIEHCPLQNQNHGALADQFFPHISKVSSTNERRLEFYRQILIFNLI